MRVGILAVGMLVSRLAAAANPCATEGDVAITRVDFTGFVDAPVEEAQRAVIATLGTALGTPAFGTDRLHVKGSISPVSLARIESAVAETGWFESATAVFGASEEECVLRIRVREYAPAQEIRFPDAKAYPADALLPLLETKVGAKPNRRALETDGEKIAAKYHEDGYRAARFLHAEVDGSVVSFHVSEGRIARIEVVGALRTRPKRVRKVLGIRAGDLYNSRALVEGQAALYRTGLFSLVGFGVEPVSEGESEKLVLTVTVGELTAPYSRTEVFSDRGVSAAAIEARLRNVGAGHSARLSVALDGVSPPDLAREGFDEYYVAGGTAELRLFRPDPAAPGARIAFDMERVHGRVREDLGLRQHVVDLPAGRLTGDIPVVNARGWEGIGTVTARLGWRHVEALPLAGGRLDVDRGPWGGGEVGLELSRIAGVEVPAEISARAGVEMHSSWKPFSYFAADAKARVAIWRGIRVEGRADAATLTGREVPWFRETALSSTPIGFGRDYGFARHHARGEIAAVAALPRDLVGVSAGWQGAVWSGAADAQGTDDAQSLVLEARIGPEFARVRGGVAAPLPGATTRDLWWFAGLVIATPY